ncbi:MAG: ATP-binding protein [Selenomonadaceae bacterium]|nr:ATP-binding protein [Selenomonadaceae bacterium]
MDMKPIFEALEKAAAKSSAPDDGDFVKDGLLYCGKCFTPKQCRVELFGEIRTPFCLCKCAAEKRDAEEAERKRVEKMQEVQKLRRLGFPDAELSRWTFDNDDGTDEKLSTAARNYVANFAEMKKRGKGLLLFGKVGTGKTFASACIANALIDKGVPCLVTNFARLVNTIAGMYDGKQDYIDGLNRFDLLVIDDLASERDTEYMGEIVQNIIDSRYRAGLPLIVTTNLTSDELKHPQEIRKQRIYSRLFEMCVPLEVKHKDRRKEKLIADFDEMNALLGLNAADEA